MSYYGDIAAAAILYIPFTTVDSTRAPIVLTGSPAVSVYKDDGGGESTAGVTLTASFDSRTGLNLVKIDTSADGTFYAAGHDFSVVVTTGTVDSVSAVGYVIGSFSIEHRSVGSGTAPSAATVAAAVWDAVRASHVTSGTFGQGAASVQGNVTGNVAGAVASVTAGVTVTTNNDKTGYRLSATGVDDVWDEAVAGHLTAGTTGEALNNAGTAGTPPSAATVADAVWDEARAGHVTAGSFGQGVASVQGNVTGSAASVTAGVTVTTNNDKTGYSLSATGLDATLPSGAVVSDAGNSATTFKSNRTESATDYWKDAYVVLTSGVMAGQVHRVIAYNGTTKFLTVSTGFTAAPAAAVTFLLVIR